MAANIVSQDDNQVYKSYVSPDQLGAFSLSSLMLFDGLEGGGGRRLDGGGEEGGEDSVGFAVKLLYLGAVIVEFFVGKCLGVHFVTFN